MAPNLAAERSYDEDVALSQRIARCDDGAFETLMRRHNRMLFRLARSILKNPADAEDAMQEAYVSAYRNIGAFRGGSGLATWLGRIVINEAYTRLRKQKRGADVLALEGMTQEDDQMRHRGGDNVAIDTAELPDVAAMRGELRRMLERKIDALPVLFRTVFLLRDVEELSVEDTAQLLDVPPATVRTRAFRARALLRASLAEEIDIATVDAFGFAGERCDRIVATVFRRLSAKTGATT
jgi:RNA polymerase sigma-70 factor (ECF subfamily)